MASADRPDTPLLVLGLGGTGLDMLLRVKSEFRRHFQAAGDEEGRIRPPHVEYALIDADTQAAQTARYGMAPEGDEIVDISDCFHRARQALGEKPYVRQWLDRDMDGGDTGQPVAGCRQAGRLLLFAHYEQVRGALTRKLERLAGSPAWNASGGVRVNVMAGVCGGTGSGLLLDVAYILRDIAREMDRAIDIEAFLMMPDVDMERFARSAGGQVTRLSVNGYAFLKEMDFWMNADDTGASMVQQYADASQVTWSGVPFDTAWLLCARDENGLRVRDPYGRNIDIVAQYLVRCREYGGAAGAASPSGLWSARAERQAVGDALRHPGPGRYRALGACGNEAENRWARAKEWSLICNEAASRLNRHPPAMGDMGRIEFGEDMPCPDRPAPGTDIGAAQRSFNARHPIPDLSALDLEGLRGQDESAAPHCAMFDRYADGLRRSRGREVELLSGELWTGFRTWARAIGTDLERGPGFLYALLSKAENGPGVALEACEGAARDRVLAAGQSIPELRARCETGFRRLRYPHPLSRALRGRRDREDYCLKARQLYAAAQAQACNVALCEALVDLRRKLGAYTAVLGDLLAGIRRQNEDYRAQLRAAEQSERPPLYDIDAMFRGLAALFDANPVGREDAVRAVYNEVVRLSEGTADGDVDLTPPPERFKVDGEWLEPARARLFGAIDAMALDEKLARWQGLAQGPELLAYIAGTLCPRLLEAAAVTFCPLPGAGGLPGDAVNGICLIDVPRGSADVRRGIQAFSAAWGGGVIVRVARDRDGIFCVNAKSILSLGACDQLGLLRERYARARGTCKGCHLYMNDAREAGDGRADPLKQDWARTLPEPAIWGAQAVADRDSPGPQTPGG